MRTLAHANRCAPAIKRALYMPHVFVSGFEALWFTCPDPPVCLSVCLFSQHIFLIDVYICILWVLFWVPVIFASVGKNFELFTTTWAFWARPSQLRARETTTSIENVVPLQFILTFYSSVKKKFAYRVWGRNRLIYPV